MEWTVYIIQCNDKSLYTGITLDLNRRFKEHVTQGAQCAKYLRGKDPLLLVYQQKVNSKSEALRLEGQIKKLSRSEKLKLICLDAMIAKLD